MQTSFSQQGVIGNRVDNSSWADTPQEKLLRLQHAGNKMLEAAENDERMQKKAEVVDKYNEKNRGETLFQQHKEKQKKVLVCKTHFWSSLCGSSLQSHYITENL